MMPITRYSVYVCFLLFCVATSEIAAKLRYGEQNDVKLKHSARKWDVDSFSKNRVNRETSTPFSSRDENTANTDGSFAPANASTDNPIGTGNETRPSSNEIIDNHSTENTTGGFSNDTNYDQAHDSGETDNNSNGSNSGENSGEVCPPMKKCYCGPTVLPQRNHTDNGNHYGQYSLQPSQNSGEAYAQGRQESQIASTTEGYVRKK